MDAKSSSRFLTTDLIETIADFPGLLGLAAAELPAQSRGHRAAIRHEREK